MALAPLSFRNRLKPLSPGAAVGIFAPGSPVSPARLATGIVQLERRGFKVKCPLDPTRFYGDYTHGFASASIGDRLLAFQDLLQDDSVEAIICARGGYGTGELLPLINFDEVREAGKAIVGYSDVTALLIAAASAAQIPAIHGPTISAEFSELHSSSDAKESVEVLLQLLTDPKYRLTAEARVLRDGVAEGPMIAGNLSILNTMIGTPWDLSYEGAILVIEEVGEAPYRVDRALRHLLHADKLSRLSGLVFGRYSKCAAKQGPTVDEVIERFAESLPNDFPILCDLPFGHNGRNLPLAIGCAARIEGRQLKVLESPLTGGAV